MQLHLLNHPIECMLRAAHDARLQPMATTPTRRTKRLGGLLEQLRTKADRNLADAAILLRINESSVSRYETGHVRPSWAALQALLGFYNAGERDRAYAASFWEDASERAIQVI